MTGRARSPRSGLQIHRHLIGVHHDHAAHQFLGELAVATVCCSQGGSGAVRWWSSWKGGDAGGAVGEPAVDPPTPKGVLQAGSLPTGRERHRIHHDAGRSEDQRGLPGSQSEGPSRPRWPEADTARHIHGRSATPISSSVTECLGADSRGLAWQRFRLECLVPWNTRRGPSLFRLQSTTDVRSRGFLVRI